MKMAKADKDDIDRCIKFFQFVEEFMEYGTHTPQEKRDPETGESESIKLTDEEFVEKLREMWGRRFGPSGVDCAWQRVVFGCDILITNVCDPNSDVLEVRPDWAAKLVDTETSEQPTSEPTA